MMGEYNDREQKVFVGFSDVVEDFSDSSVNLLIKKTKKEKLQRELEKCEEEVSKNNDIEAAQRRQSLRDQLVEAVQEEQAAKLELEAAETSVVVAGDNFEGECRVEAPYFRLKQRGQLRAAAFIEKATDFPAAKWVIAARTTGTGLRDAAEKFGVPYEKLVTRGQQPPPPAQGAASVLQQQQVPQLPPPQNDPI